MTTDDPRTPPPSIPLQPTAPQPTTPEATSSSRHAAPSGSTPAPASAPAPHQQAADHAVPPGTPSAPQAQRPAKVAIPPQRFHRVPWRSVAIFSAIAYAIMAVCAAPFWILDGGVAHPLYTWIISIAMFAPTIATVVVAKAVDKQSWRTATGLRFRGRWKQIGIWSVLGLVLVLALNIATGVIMVLRGVPGDLTGRTWAGIVDQQMTEAGAPMPLAVAILLILLITAVNLAVTCLPALGEEIGWRGWLWPRLDPLGRPLAIILGGAIWSLWHLPIVLIGHNYAGENRLAAIAVFLPACMAMNVLFGALTERAVGNPIPAGIAHATLNSTLAMALSIVATMETTQAINMFLDSPLGLTGMILFTLVGLAIMPRKRPSLAGRVTDVADGAAEDAAPERRPVPAAR